MDTSFRSGLILIAGIGLLIASALANSLSVNSNAVANILLIAGLILTGWSVAMLRTEIIALFRQRRGEQLLTTLGIIAVIIAVIWLAALFPTRIDMTADQQYSLSPQTITMLKALDKPVHITFFHDRGMRETVELYEQFAVQNDKIQIEFFDPILNPAQAKLRGVQFAGTALFESEGRKLTVNGPTETDIANGILRITQSKQQIACFVEGHGEPDPFSLESHDHMEGTAGHAHGIETKVVTHEQHGMAKARSGLEAMNYTVEKISLLQKQADLSRCDVLIVAGPQAALLPNEIKKIDAFLDDGGNALFMVDPFIPTGLAPVLRKFGIVQEEAMVIDDASHFWADPSTPAVTDYNRHEITSRLPLSFFPGVGVLSPTKESIPGVSVRPIINSSKKSYSSLEKTTAAFVDGKSQRGPLTMMAVSNLNSKAVASAEEMVKRIRGEKIEEKAADANPRKSARIAVIADADFATNSFYHILGNGALFLNTVNYLAARENLIGLEPRTFDLPYVNMTNTQMKATFIMSIILIPLLMAAIGAAVWWRRR